MFSKEKKNVIGERVIEPKITIFGSYLSLMIAIIVFVIASVILFKGIKFKANGVEVTAEVTSVIENDTERSIYIEYEVDGIKYNNKLGYWDEELDLHSNVNIIYLKSDPMQITGKSNYILLAVLVYAISIGVGLMSFLTLRKYFKERNRIYKLLKDGIKKEGTVVCAEDLNIYSNNTFNAWALTATIGDEVYDSSKFWVKAPIVGVENSKIDIYIDKDNKNNYYIDLLSLRGGRRLNQGEEN